MRLKKTAAFSVTAVTGGPVPVKFKFPGSSGVVRPPYKRRTIPANMSLSVRLQRMLLRLSHINRGTISLENGIVKQTNFHCSNLYPQCGQSDRVKKRSHRRNPPHSGQRQYFRVPKMTEPKPAIRRKNAMIFVPGISIAAMTLGTKREPIHSSTAHILQRYGVILTHPLLYFCACVYRIARFKCRMPAICTLLHCKYNRGPVKIKCELLLF